MSTDKFIQESNNYSNSSSSSNNNNIVHSNNNEIRYNPTITSVHTNSDSDSDTNRKMPAFILPPMPNSHPTRARAVLNHYDNEQHRALATSRTLNDPLLEARALVERQHQQLDETNKTYALLRAREMLAQQELKMVLLDKVRKETMYRGTLTGAISSPASATIGEANVRIGGSSRKRPLEEDILLAEREQILRRVRQEKEMILLNNLRKGEILASERRKQDDDQILNALFSKQNAMLQGASTLNPSDPLSRLTMYKNDSLSFAPQPSRLPPLFRDALSAGPRGRTNPINNDLLSGRINPNNDLPFNRSGCGLGSGISQADQGLSSFYNNFKTLTASSHAETSRTNSIHSSTSTTNAHTGANWNRTSTLGSSPTSCFASVSSSHQQETNNTGLDFLWKNSDDEIEQREELNRFNKHQCKQWTVKYQELLAFKKKEGNCNVPHLYKENRGLAMWVKRQRHQHNLLVEKKPSTLTGERIKLLESIGFVWNCLDSSWERNFEDLRIFAICNGHFSVPPTYEKNPKLASWVVTQRRQCKLLEDGKQSSMAQKRFEKLKQIGFPVWINKVRKPSSPL
uniref:Helicase-associated domain-containing protein n=2 Tax=Pseudo-nitzschia australis TaxID=44445 RepID=A0A7S4AT58_9STRA|mmetsp:Transcript_4761/g.10459  ORF Transcript_4761/g.10459 Transcript_4761/m.10459 type:complete len:571 (-) Transcript_4761:280-1992(-)